jgi:hypothetical protein
VFRKPGDAVLLAKVGERLSIEAGSVPLTVIGDRVWIGYSEHVGREIEARIAECRARGCADVVSALRSGAATPPAVEPGPTIPRTVRLPFLGEVRTAGLSLPALTVLLAAVDGFNPCAMWVLVFLLGLLAGMKDRARMWLLGGAFVAASASVYFLILGAWLNVLLFAGAIVFVRIGVGIVALAGGAYYLREFFANADMKCEVTASGRRRRIFARLREIAQQRSFLPALAGIVALAFAVNVVEFLCSAGIPAVFTQVLALSALSAWQYGAFLALYVLVFMLDDLLVLAAALRTLEVTGLTTRYARWSNAIGGTALVGVGLLLVFRPEWLAFA